jgi:hypothetical protein
MEPEGSLPRSQEPATGRCKTYAVGKGRYINQDTYRK